MTNHTTKALAVKMGVTTGTVIGGAAASAGSTAKALTMARCSGKLPKKKFKSILK